METLDLPKRVIEQYKHNFMVRVPVYDGYIEELEKYPEVEIDRVYSCLDCYDTGTRFDEERGEIKCLCQYDWAAEPNRE